MHIDPSEFTVRDLQKLMHDVLHEALTDESAAPTSLPESWSVTPIAAFTDTPTQAESYMDAADTVEIPAASESAPLQVTPLRPLITETAQITAAMTHAPRAQRLTRREFDLLDS